MLVISHRGNLDGPEGDCDKDRVTVALSLGFDVEIDVRYHAGERWVGHDRPLYPLDQLWNEGSTTRLWHHAKDLDAFRLSSEEGSLTFAHSVDAFVPVRNTHAIWTHPHRNEELIARYDRDLVLLDVDGYPRLKRDSLQRLPFAVCTDWPIEWLEWYVGKVKAGWR